LDHKPEETLELSTILQPKMKKKKSVTKLNVKDTQDADKYCLTHQEQDSNDEIVTKLIKVSAAAASLLATVFPCLQPALFCSKQR
jgi:kinesin family protein 23